MEVFFLLNVLICITTGILLATFIRKYRFLLVKPSLLYLLFFFLLIQIPATIYSGTTFTKLDNWYDYFLLTQMYPLAGVVVTLFTFHDAAELAFNRINNKKVSINPVIVGAYCVLLVFIVSSYLFYVGFSNTGIYAILFESTAGQAALAREESLKLLDSPAIKYLYTLLGSAVSPVLLVMLSLHVGDGWGKINQFMGTITGILGILLCFGAIIFPGHRWGPMLMILTIFMAFLYRSGFHSIRWSHFLGITCTLIVVMVTLSVMREGVDFSSLGLQGTFSYFFQIDDIFDIESWSKKGVFWSVSYRVLLDQMKSGWDYARYVAEYGYWGIQAIPKLAYLVGVDSVNVANELHNYYYPTSLIKSGSYTTGFVFAYYSYFGIGAVIVSTVFLWLLDSILILYSLLDDSLLLPVVATVAVASLSLIGAEYTTALLTHGVLSSIVIALGIQELYRLCFRSNRLKGID